MQIHKSTLLEKLVHRIGQCITYTENRPKSIGAETQMGYLAQKLQAVFFRLQRIFFRIAVA